MPERPNGIGLGVMSIKSDDYKDTYWLSAYAGSKQSELIFVLGISCPPHIYIKSGITDLKQKHQIKEKKNVFNEKSKKIYLALNNSDYSIAFL